MTSLIMLFSGDVGGVLGLLLGASAFTIIEFAQFTIFAVAKYCFGWSKVRWQSWITFVYQFLGICDF